jgi:hypothetical protein
MREIRRSAWLLVIPDHSYDRAMALRFATACIGFEEEVSVRRQVESAGFKFLIKTTSGGILRTGETCQSNRRTSQWTNSCSNFRSDIYLPECLLSQEEQPSMVRCGNAGD